MISTTVGKVSVTPQGSWSGSNTYTRLDIVTNDGCSYIAKQDVPENIQLNNTEYWVQLASKGKGITSITKTSTSGLIDTYTIIYSDYSTSTFDISNGNGITNISLNPDYTLTIATDLGSYTTASIRGETGAAGATITSITKTSTSGLVDTYTVALSDGRNTTFTVTNGSSISTISKTSTSGLVDTYTVSLTDGSTSTFTVTNGAQGETGNGIASITKTSTSGLVDTYTILYTNGTSSTFTVTNGAGFTPQQIDKLDSLPDATGVNGTYIITETSGEMTLSPDRNVFKFYGDFVTPISFDGTLSNVTSMSSYQAAVTAGTVDSVAFVAHTTLVVMGQNVNIGDIIFTSFFIDTSGYPHFETIIDPTLIGLIMGTDKLLVRLEYNSQTSSWAVTTAPIPSFESTGVTGEYVLNDNAGILTLVPYKRAFVFAGDVIYNTVTKQLTVSNVDNTYEDFVTSDFENIDNILFSATLYTYDNSTTTEVGVFSLPLNELLSEDEKLYFKNIVSGNIFNLDNFVSFDVILNGREETPSSWVDIWISSVEEIIDLADTTPLMNGVAAPGVSTSASRSDHVHPSDTTKANVDGQYEDLASGKLIPRHGTVNNAPYLSRPSFSGDREIDKLVGGTVVWNQYWNQPNPITAPQGANTGTLGIVYNIPIISGHKYYMKAYQETTMSSNTRNTLAYSDGTTHFQSTSTNNHITAGNMVWLFSPSSTTNNGAVYIWCHTPDVPVTYSGFTCVDLTAMFGSTIADYVYSLGTDDGIAWLQSYGFFTEDYIPYDTGTLKSVEATAHIMKDADDNVIGNYPLDDIVLRGIPKLDASNKLYYDGDEYSSDGTVTRRFNVVSLANISWTSRVVGDVNRAYSATLPSNYIGQSSPNIFRCDQYEPIGSTSTSNLNTTVDSKSVGLYKYSSTSTVDNTIYLVIPKGDTPKTTGSLIYKLNTSTTESADPFTNPQIVDADGTETYTTTNNVPVGHETEYIELDGNISIPIPPDGDNYYLISSNDILEWSSIDNDPIREKVEYLPDVATNNGTYLITQTDNKMSLTSYTAPTTLAQLSDDSSHRLVTDTQITNWGTAYSNSHTHSNKSVLDGITADKVSSWDAKQGDLEEGTDYLNTTHLAQTYVAATSVGANNGVAELDANGKVPSSQLPSFVDDVLEYNSSSDFPASGESGKIYIAKDTSLAYRWGGSGYAEISPSLALGETSGTAYRGDRGKVAYDHSQDSTIHVTTSQKSNWDTAYTNNHTHVNKTVLDDISSTDVTNWGTAYTNNHTHSNKALLDTYEQTETNLADAVTKKHSHSNKTVLDGITSTNVTNWGTAYTNSHTHSNKTVLDGITSTNVTNWGTAYTNSHTHSNKSVIDGISSSDVTAWDGAVTDSHTHTNKSVLDDISSTDVTAWNSAVSDSHTHTNLSLLETYTQTETNLADAVTNSHTHTNKTVLDGITSTNVTNWGTAYTNSHTHSNKTTLDGISSTDITNWNGKQKAITYGTTDPSGGSVGDIYIKYTT